MPGDACFIAATDTGVGKTLLAAAIVASLRARGVAVAVRKPLLTGLSEPGTPDDVLLAAASGEQPQLIAPLRFEPPFSPHLAARLAGREIDVAAIAAQLRELAARVPALVVEGVGGLLVPLAPGADVRELARSLAFPLLVAARPGLGTINHTLLTLEAARNAGLDVRAVVLTPWPLEPSLLERSNRDEIAALGEVEVACLPALSELTPRSLAAAGEKLPYERWMAR